MILIFFINHALLSHARSLELGLKLDCRAVFIIIKHGHLSMILSSNSEEGAHTAAFSNGSLLYWLHDVAAHK